MRNGRLAGPYLLILPSLLLAAFIILWPLKELVQIALHEVNRFGQLRDFAGMANFAALRDDPDFIASAWRTLTWTIGVVGGALIVSVPVALILNQDFYGRGIARVIVMLPWAVSLTMTAIVWRWALSGESGMLNSALTGPGHHRHQRAVAGASLYRLSHADPDRRARDHPLHRDDLPGRPVLDPRRSSTRRRRSRAPTNGSSSATSRCR